MQQAVHGHRGRAGDPLYTARRTLHTGADLYTDKQRERIRAPVRRRRARRARSDLGIYQRMIAAYREPDRAKGRHLMSTVIQSVSSGVPAALKEVRRLGRTLKPDLAH